MTTQTDSPLSVTSSVAGIFTFVVAIAAAIYARFNYLRNADIEYFEVKASLSWYKTESIWLHDLINAADRPSGNEMEYQMYIFVMDQLGKLEERLLELLTETEIRATSGRDSEGEGGSITSRIAGRRWTLVPEGVRGNTAIAVAWLRVRGKALELVRQRDALGSRVLFAQMSLVSSRVRDQEARQKKREESHRERLERLESTVNAQNEKLDRLEGLVYRTMHRSKIEEGLTAEDRYDQRHHKSLDISSAATSTTASPQPSPPLVKPGMAVRYHQIQEDYKNT
ncbi:hypothetical protein BP5796_00526 [Coleophoma crateriformis]|uniref:Uncharacterized protein n=1 Tax=Coleophoma crateriformis TaxID=565419 RepID=A0A3D8T861_9HELO|nr:hypothetical protein BP5796_00526 [Coleophoma crateriformis]